MADRLYRHLGGLTVYSNAWSYDYGWLATLFDAAARTPRFRLQHLHALLDANQARSLPAVHADVLAALQPTHHRARSDARALQLALRRLRQPLRRQ